MQTFFLLVLSVWKAIQQGKRRKKAIGKRRKKAIGKRNLTQKRTDQTVKEFMGGLEV